MMQKQQILYSIWAVLVLNMLLGMFNPSRADTILASGVSPSQNLSKTVELHYTNQGLLLSDVLQLEDWNEQFSIEPMPDGKVMWLRFSINNPDVVARDLILIAGNTFVDRIDGFLLDEQGRIVQSIQKNNVEPSANQESLHGFKMDFSLRPEQAFSVYLRVHDDGPATFPIEIWEAEAFGQQETQRLILLGVLSGGLSLLATYFFITYIVRSTASRFWFSIFTIAAMTTLLSAEGILPILFKLPGYAAEITAFALMITIFAAIKVGRIIFSPVSQTWLRAHYILLAVPFISLFISNDFWQFVTLLIIIAVFLISKLAATLVYRRQVDLRSTAFYFSGWLALGAVAGLEILGFLSGASHLSNSAALPFAFTCLGIMLIGVGIISREESIQQKATLNQTKQVAFLSDYLTIFDNSVDGLYSAKLDGELLKVNAAMSHLFGFLDSEHLLSKYKQLHDLFADAIDADLLFGELSIQRTVVGKELKGRRLDGSEFWFSISCSIQKGATESIHYGSVFDVTERRLHQLNMQYLNTHDQLTGLYNRRYFLQILEETVQHSQAKIDYALLYIDVDQFKIINDTCGHTAGDVYIKELAHELFDVVAEEHYFARLSADEFGLLISYHKDDDIDAVTQRILTKVRGFVFKWDKHRFSQSVSIGICKYDANMMTAEELMSYADTACIVAKEQGRDKVHMYSSELGVNASYERELFWINEVNRALVDDSFELYYQHYRPLNSASTQDFFEVLVRLRTADKNLVLPELFMPAAERYKLSHKVDKWVIENTFIWLNTHSEHQANLNKCNINLSGPSLSDEEFKFFLLNAFEKYQIPYEKICFEITETMAIIKMTDALIFISEFKKLGCTFALDDFGTGFSSYSYLKNLPVDFVKIDGNFIRDILNDPIDLAMVTSIKDIAEAMSIKTVAEFVETKDIMVQLGKMGVDFAQGFCIAEPDRLDNFTRYTDWIQ